MSEVKIDKEGVVRRGSEIIGHVKKEITQGLYATLLGVSASASGKALWYPFAADGTKLSEYGYETRKRAIERIDKHTQPLTVTDLRLERGLMTSAERCVSATVKYKGYTLGVSRYANDEYWIVDFLSTPDSIMPVFSNGTGARVTAVRPIKPEFAQAVTDAAVAAGLWPIPAEEN